MSGKEHTEGGELNHLPLWLQAPSGIVCWAFADWYLLGEVLLTRARKKELSKDSDSIEGSQEGKEDKSGKSDS